MSASEKDPKLQPHPLVAALIDDPASPRDVVQFVGYAGKSTRAHHARLYLSLAFDEYLDIPTGAIAHHAEVPDTELAHGGTRVWVDASADVVHETRQSTRTEARYLEGAIAAEYLQAGAAEPAAEADYGDQQAFGTLPTRPPMVCISLPIRTCATCPLRTCASCPLRTCVTCAPSVCLLRTCATPCIPSRFARTCAPVLCPIVSVRLCPFSLRGCPPVSLAGRCGGPEIPGGPGPIEIPVDIDQRFGAGYAPQGYGGGYDPYGGNPYGGYGGYGPWGG